MTAIVREGLNVNRKNVMVLAHTGSLTQVKRKIKEWVLDEKNSSYN